MPEGDTIYKLAANLRPDLVGRRLLKVEMRDRGELKAFRGARVERIETHGKNLVIVAEGAWSLRTHLGIAGDVHRYLVGEPWKRSRERAVLVLETERRVQLVWLQPAQAEPWKTAFLRANPELARLGPDLMDDEVDLDRVVARARGVADARGRPFTIAELLMDQSVAAGIGNAYKSELLFIERVDPWTPALEVDDDLFARLYGLAHRLLVRNRRPGARITVPDDVRHRFRRGRLMPTTWVYEREGRACLRCGEPVRKKRQGSQARRTFFCAACQLVALFSGP